MRLLFITPFVPSPARIRTYNQMRELAARGHEIVLYTVQTELNERAGLEALYPICKEVRVFTLPPWRRAWNSLRALSAGLPPEAVMHWHPALAHLVQQTARFDSENPFDLIHVVHLRGARYGVLAASRGQRSLPVVWDAIDSASLFINQRHLRSSRWQDRLMARLEYGRIELYEGWLMEQTDQVLVTSPEDRRWMISRQTPGKESAPISVLPNGVDLEYFQPYPTGESETLILTGNMSQHANIMMAMHMAEEIMPLIWGRIPGARLSIVGYNPAPEVRRLGKDPRIDVTGAVADIRPYLRRSAIAVAPLLYNLGIQNKILEAMAAARPVVATPQAVSGLQAKPGYEIIVAQDIVQFSEALVELLQDPMRQRLLGLAGRRYVERIHPWSAVGQRLEEIYKAVLARPARHPG